MRLRTFESFWLLKNGLMYSYPSLKENEACDIVVIGGGITGALISDALLENGYDVIVLDKRDIGQGSTSATTSMLQYEIDVSMHKLSEMIGEKGAALCYGAGIDAINELEALIKDRKIKCGFERKKSIYFAHNVKAVNDLKKEFALRNKHLQGVTWMEKDALWDKYGLVSEVGIVSEAAASMDAYAFTHELIRQNVKKGLRVYDQTTIKTVDHSRKGVQVTTEEGAVIKAKKVVYCSGFETTEILKENIAKLFYTYATVGERNVENTQKLKDVLLWNTEDPYLYLRTTDDGRLLLGGEDTSSHIPFFEQKRKEKKSNALQKKLKAILPHIDFVEDFSWGGTFGSTSDGLPYIGVSPEYKNALFVLGFGGNGITFSVQGRQIILDILQKKKSPLAKFYRFGR